MLEMLALAALFVIALAWQQRAADLRAREWAQERSELLTRIQRPEWVPMPAGAPETPWVIPEDEGELNLVGAVIEGTDGD